MKFNSQIQGGPQRRGLQFEFQRLTCLQSKTYLNSNLEKLRPEQIDRK